jgi:hypothetical protein
MPQKQSRKKVVRTLGPATHTSPFTNLTNNLSSQQHQYSATQLFASDPLNEIAKHTDPLNETRYSVYMDDPLSKTRYPVNINSFIIILYMKDNKFKSFFCYRHLHNRLLLLFTMKPIIKKFNHHLTL